MIARSASNNEPGALCGANDAGSDTPPDRRLSEVIVHFHNAEPDIAESVHSTSNAPVICPTAGADPAKFRTVIVVVLVCRLPV